MKCAICKGKIEKEFAPDGTVFWDKGHNPAPVKTGPEDRCCAACNWAVVVPARILAGWKGGAPWKGGAA